MMLWHPAYVIYIKWRHDVTARQVFADNIILWITVNLQVSDKTLMDLHIQFDADCQQFAQLIILV